MHTTPIQQVGLRSPVAIKSMPAAGNAVSQLPVSQVRTLREGFQILDRDSDGVANRDDVADMLTQLGKNTSGNSNLNSTPPDLRLT